MTCMDIIRAEFRYAFKTSVKVYKKKEFSESFFLNYFTVQPGTFVMGSRIGLLMQGLLTLT